MGDQQRAIGSTMQQAFREPHAEYDEYIEASTEVEKGLKEEVRYFVQRVGVWIHAMHPLKRGDLLYLPISELRIALWFPNAVSSKK